LVKALLLRGGSDTLDSQVAVIQNQKKELEKQIADLDALINDVDSSPVLKTELEKLKNLLSGLSGSLTTVLEGGRVKRSTTMTCSDLTVIITAHEYVTTLVDDILNHMNTIGTNTGNTDLDNFIATAIEMFSQIDVKTQLQLFKEIQAQQCGNSTDSSAGPGKV
jgi:DNA gyrase/topoisomerase IV subunit A